MFNGYAELLDRLRPGTTVLECILAGIFLTHIFFTVCVVYENIKARGGLTRYAVDQSVGKRRLSERLMPISALYIFCYLVWHIYDFTLADAQGPRSLMAGHSQGIYGVVVNSFKVPWHSCLYIAAVCFLGLHLAHGVQSVIQTWGIQRPKCSQCLMTMSSVFGLLIAMGFSSIPLYVMLFLR